MTPGEGLALAALSLVGVPFRLHGRSPSAGLDCIGVLAAALEMAGRPAKLPNGYALRCTRDPDFDRIARAAGLVPSTAEAEAGAGDILALRPSPWQLHFGIALSATEWVHAHSGLRKVVFGPIPSTWPTAGRWRLSPHSRN